jgi:tripartite-type tricarboxylate transporter receptor subunit TctC
MSGLYPLRRAAALATLALLPLSCFAQAYPSKPIHLIVPFPPGGVADLIARPVAEKLTQSLGQTVIVENRGGATGTIGASYVAHAAPDGYTLLLGTTNEIAMSPTLYKKLPYDPTQAFAAITPVADFPNVLVTGPTTSVTSLHALIDLARSSPRALEFASSGEGSTNHLTAELFKTQAQVKILHIPYKGGGPALVDVTGGHVDAMFATLPSAITLIKAGRLKALAVTSEQRSGALPDVPTARESGLPDLVVTTWNGVLAPAGTPPEIVKTLHDALVKAVADPDLKQKFAAVGAEAHTTTPEAFTATIRSDFDRWSGVIQRAGIKID